MTSGWFTYSFICVQVYIHIYRPFQTTLTTLRLNKEDRLGDLFFDEVEISF